MSTVQAATTFLLCSFTFAFTRRNTLRTHRISYLTHFFLSLFLFGLGSVCIALFVPSGTQRAFDMKICLHLLLCMGERAAMCVRERALIFWAFGMFNVKVVALGRMRIRVRQTEIMCYIFVGTYSMLRTNEKFDVHSFGCRLWILSAVGTRDERSAVGRKHSKTI